MQIATESHSVSTVPRDARTRTRNGPKRAGAAINMNNMNDSTRVIRRPRRIWPPGARTATAILVTASFALLATACDSSSHSSASAQSTNTQKALAYSGCMRSHGVSGFPDPTDSGQVPKVSLQQLGVSRSSFLASQTACQGLLPISDQSSPGQDQKVLPALFSFARCVRANGVSNWPDPLAESDPGEPDTPGFPRDIQGVNQNAPEVKAAMDTCQHFLAGIGYRSGGYP